MTELTRNQKAMIDTLLGNYPAIHSLNAEVNYQPSYSRSYKIYIKAAEWRWFLVTHCDHRKTANKKLELVRAYIVERKAAQS